MYTVFLLVMTVASAVIPLVLWFVGAPIGRVHYEPVPVTGTDWDHFLVFGFWVFPHSTNNYLMYLVFSSAVFVPYIYRHYRPFWVTNLTKVFKKGLYWPSISLAAFVLASYITITLAGSWELIENAWSIVGYMITGMESYFNETAIDFNVGDMILALAMSIFASLLLYLNYIPLTMGILIWAHGFWDFVVIVVIVSVVLSWQYLVPPINLVINGYHFNLGFLLFIWLQLLLFRVMEWYHTRIARRVENRGFVTVGEVRRFYLYIHVYFLTIWVVMAALLWPTYPAMIVGHAIFVVILIFLNRVLPSLKKRRRQKMWREDVLTVRKRKRKFGFGLIRGQLFWLTAFILLLVAGFVAFTVVYTITTQENPWRLIWNYRGKLHSEPGDFLTGHKSILTENVHRTFSHYLNPFLFYCFFGSIAFYPITVCRSAYLSCWRSHGSVRKQKRRNWPPNHWFPYAAASSVTIGFVVLWKIIDTALTHIGVESFNLTGQDAPLGETSIAFIVSILTSLYTYFIYPPLPGLLLAREGRGLIWLIHILLFTGLYAILRILPGLAILDLVTEELTHFGFYLVSMTSMVYLFIMEWFHASLARNVPKKKRIVTTMDVHRFYVYVQITVVLYWAAFFGMTLHSYISLGIGVALQLAGSVMLKVIM